MLLLLFQLDLLFYFSSPSQWKSCTLSYVKPELSLLSINLLSPPFHSLNICFSFSFLSPGGSSSSANLPWQLRRLWTPKHPNSSPPLSSLATIRLQIYFSSITIASQPHFLHLSTLPPTYLTHLCSSHHSVFSRRFHSSCRRLWSCRWWRLRLRMIPRWRSKLWWRRR